MDIKSPACPASRALPCVRTVQWGLEISQDRSLDSSGPRFPHLRGEHPSPWDGSTWISGVHAWQVLHPLSVLTSPAPSRQHFLEKD